MVRSQRDSFTIGALAARAGVHVETVRYYQRLGLIAVPQRPVRGVRRYAGSDVARLHFICRAKHAGFTLAEIQSLLVAREDGACAKTRALAARKLETIDGQLRALKSVQRDLRGLVAACDSKHNAPGCPAIDILDQK